MSALEDRVQGKSRELAAQLRRGRATPLGRRWWDERLMGFTTKNEALKVQLFRFVDTLPYLEDPAEVSRHLREYLGEAADDLPWWTRAGMGFIPRQGIGGRLLAKTAKSNAKRMARKFIAGSNLK